MTVYSHPHLQTVEAVLEFSENDHITVPTPWQFDVQHHDLYLAQAADLQDRVRIGCNTVSVAGHAIQVGDEIKMRRVVCVATEIIERGYDAGYDADPEPLFGHVAGDVTTVRFAVKPFGMAFPDYQDPPVQAEISDDDFCIDF